MEKEQVSDVIAGLVLKGFAALIVITMLYTCVSKNTNWLKSDYSKPHTYISTKAYGAQGKDLSGNDYMYLGIGITDFRDNFFKNGSGECEKRLHRIKAGLGALDIQIHNEIVRERGDYNDIPVSFVIAQCVEFLGTDKDCQERLLDVADKNTGTEIAVTALAASMTFCRKEKIEGKPRGFSISDIDKPAY